MKRLFYHIKASIITTIIIEVGIVFVNLNIKYINPLIWSKEGRFGYFYIIFTLNISLFVGNCIHKSLKKLN